MICRQPKIVVVPKGNHEPRISSRRPFRAVGQIVRRLRFRLSDSLPKTSGKISADSIKRSANNGVLIALAIPGPTFRPWAENPNISDGIEDGFRRYLI